MRLQHFRLGLFALAMWCVLESCLGATKTYEVFQVEGSWLTRDDLYIAYRRERQRSTYSSADVEGTITNSAARYGLVKLSRADITDGMEVDLVGRVTDRPILFEGSGFRVQQSRPGVIVSNKVATIRVTPQRVCGLPFNIGPDLFVAGRLIRNDLELIVDVTSQLTAQHGQVAIACAVADSQVLSASFGSRAEVSISRTDILSGVSLGTFKYQDQGLLLTVDTGWRAFSPDRVVLSAPMGQKRRIYLCDSSSCQHWGGVDPYIYLLVDTAEKQIWTISQSSPVSSKVKIQVHTY